MRVETAWTPEADRVFAEKVRAERMARGWSQEQLAERMREAGAAHATQVLVSRIEKATRELRIADAYAVAAALGISVNDLLWWEVTAGEVAMRAAMDHVQRQWDQFSSSAERLLAAQEELARIADELGTELSVAGQEVLRMLRLGPDEMLRNMRDAHLEWEREVALGAGYSVEEFRRKNADKISVGEGWPTLEKTWSAVYGEHPEAS